MMDGLLTYEDLRTRWGRQGQPLCKRQVIRICARLRLKPLDMGHRTKRFRPADVLRAEARAAGERGAA